MKGIFISTLLLSGCVGPQEVLHQYATLGRLKGVICSANIREDCPAKLADNATLITTADSIQACAYTQIGIIVLLNSSCDVVKHELDHLER